MDELLKLAVVGLDKQATASQPAQHPADTLIQSDPPDDVARELLLKAGCRAVYRQAGQVPGSVPKLPPAPQDATATNSPKIVSVIQTILATDSRDLLEELVQLMHSAGSTFPHLLLPAVLSIQDPDLRETLRPVLGSRGLWLSQFNPSWSWVTEDVTHLDSRETTQFKQLWDEGNIPERCRVLGRIRRSSPQLAREWLSESFTREKPPHRAKLLEVLQTGLSHDDEPFLETAVKDRSEAVRTIAHELLCQLPQSGHADWIRELGLKLLSAQQSGAGLCVSCSPDDELQKLWEKFAGSRKAPSGAGQKAFLVQSILAAIPPSRWSDAFHSTPEQIVPAFRNETFHDAILSGLTDALFRFASRDESSREWAEVLWDEWIERSRAVRGEALAECYDRLVRLAPHFEPQVAEDRLIQVFEKLTQNAEAPAIRGHMLTVLPRPWSASFSRKLLSLSRDLLARRSDAMAVQWAGVLPVVARYLPPECFVEAGHSWKLVEGKATLWQQAHIERELERFLDQIRMRHTLYQELRPG